MVRIISTRCAFVNVNAHLAKIARINIWRIELPLIRPVEVARDIAFAKSKSCRPTSFSADLQVTDGLQTE